ncbi:hypothetical protein Mapa_001285 [Marchantia paleacea]|nr:hypothetical protein Mapa_001285 [Marchantia paleacea]
MPRRNNSETSVAGTIPLAASSVLTSSNFLNVGQTFAGSEYDGHPIGSWSFKVKIQGCDIQRGYLCGEMEEGPVDGGQRVVKFWEGEIIDNQNYTFYESKWNVNWNLHRVHWSQFPEFCAIQEKVEMDGGVFLDSASSECTFMRWKEKFCTEPTSFMWESRLHFVCFRKCDGTIKSRFQERFPCAVVHNLTLQPSIEGCSGYSFPTYQFQ